MPGPRSRVRSDFTLRLLLEKIVEYGLSDHIRNLVEDAQRHMGYRSPYRGGRTLTDLLRQAHAGARAEDDQDAAERLEDALSYATNIMVAPDLEIKYQLLGGARGRHANALTTIVSHSATFVADQVRTFLDDHPQATRDELMAYLDEMKRLVITDVAGAAGVFELSRGMNEQATWMTEVLLDRLHTDDSSVGVTPTAEASAEEIADVVLLRARRRALRELDAVVLNRHSSERDLQRALEKNLWIFGGMQLADRPGPRRISSGIELDLTLLRPDGTVHVVELKRAAVALLTHQRDEWQVRPGQNVQGGGSGKITSRHPVCPQPLSPDAAERHSPARLRPSRCTPGQKTDASHPRSGERRPLSSPPGEMSTHRSS
ncbi:hypothetical protein ABT297_06490 [Dactylosporangium sp. NPDC000555]|uniref:hypothetical protein n=1 Tax=Dactylosporangium sp. NPDC000555 TaxID=3154260 RepID=UPI003320BDC4